MKKKVFALLLAAVLLCPVLLPAAACAEKAEPRPILYTYYRQMGWGDRIQIGYVDSEGGLWTLEGHDSVLQWPYGVEDQIRYLTEHEFEPLEKLDWEALFDLRSLVAAAPVSDEKPHSAACDAGTERSYAVRYSREGAAEPVLLGMSGDDCFENIDPNAQGLYLALRKLFPNVTSYFGVGTMGPVGFLPVPLTVFCGLGDLRGASVTATYMDCEAGPKQRELSREDVARILSDTENAEVTGKVSATDTTGGFTVYAFRDRKGESLGSFCIYNGLLYASDGMYSIAKGEKKP